MKNWMRYIQTGAVGMALFLGAVPLSALAQTPYQPFSYFRFGEYQGGGERRGSAYYYPLPSGPLASALSVSCAPLDTVASIGRSVTWIASATGGAGAYTYIWSGTDGLAGASSAAQKAYLTPGDKFGTVTVSSGAQTVSAGCTRGVTIVPFGGTSASALSLAAPRLGASCYAAQEKIAPGESATWFAVVSGASGAATTTYLWDGSDGLTGAGPVAFKTYTAQGRKHALLSVTSGKERAVAACTNTITVAPRSLAGTSSSKVAVSPLQGLCTASASQASLGEEVRWSAIALGGDGRYSFSWQGDEGLSGKTATVAKKYETEGVKKATVVIASGSGSAAVPCATEVAVRTNGTGLIAGALAAFVSPSSVLTAAALAAIALGVFFAMRKKRMEAAGEAKG